MRRQQIYQKLVSEYKFRCKKAVKPTAFLLVVYSAENGKIRLTPERCMPRTPRLKSRRSETAKNACLPKSRRIPIASQTPSEPSPQKAKSAETVRFPQSGAEKGKSENCRTSRSKCRNNASKPRKRARRTKASATNFDDKENQKIYKANLKRPKNHSPRRAAPARLEKPKRKLKKPLCPRQKMLAAALKRGRFAEYSFRLFRAF